MEGRRVHYEIFVRARANAPWTLRFADEDRDLVVRTAEGMLASGAAAIRVTRDTFDPETREYRSWKVLEKGEVLSRKREPAPLEPSPLCVTPADLYTVHARERIGRLLESWLKRNRVTPFELLHRADMAERLELSTVELQHAVQKVSIPEAQSRGVGVHEVTREFQGLAERALARVQKDRQRGAFPDLDPKTFATVTLDLIAAPEGAYRLGGGVAKHLAGADWAEKVTRLLDLAEAAPAEEPGRAFAKAVLEQPLAEILGAWGGLGDLLGETLDLGGGLLALTRLAAPKQIEALISAEAGLGALIPPPSPAAERLAEWMLREPSANLRMALAGRVLRELNSGRRLRPGDPDGEVAVLRVLALALTAAAGRLLAPEDVRAVFLDRSRMIVANAFVEDYVSRRKSALEQARALLHLAENVVGPAHRLSAARYINGCVASLRFERELREGADGVGARLAAVAELHRLVVAARLPDPEQASILDKLEWLGGQLEADTALVAKLAHAHAPAAQRLSALLRLSEAETGPPGPVAARARAAAVRLGADPAVKTELAAADPLTLQPLLGRLQSALAAGLPRQAA